MLLPVVFYKYGKTFIVKRDWYRYVRIFIFNIYLKHPLGYPLRTFYNEVKVVYFYYLDPFHEYSVSP